MNKETETNDRCEFEVVHTDVVNLVKAGLSKEEVLKVAAELFKILGDPSRLRIINALILSEMCVCDLATLLEMSQPAVSHHLKALRQTRLVRYRRSGKEVYYSLDDEHVSNVFYQGLMHASEEALNGKEH
jgi:ArsR family transcriptional regulator